MFILMQCKLQVCKIYCVNNVINVRLFSCLSSLGFYVYIKDFTSLFIYSLINFKLFIFSLLQSSLCIPMSQRNRYIKYVINYCVYTKNNHIQPILLFPSHKMTINKPLVAVSLVINLYDIQSVTTVVQPTSTVF